MSRSIRRGQGRNGARRIGSAFLLRDAWKLLSRAEPSVRVRHRLSLEALEARQLLTTNGILGDANRDGTFDQNDIAAVLKADKYLTGEHAEWSDGDWNGDGLFNQLDLVAALRGAAYVPDSSSAISDPSAGTLDQEPIVTPGELGSGAFEALQFGDPLENTVLVEPPEANNQGTAELAHLLFVPPGRAGMQPDLALTYDSAGGNGWAGVGWDLSVGEVTIDTRWGAPLYCGSAASACTDDVESETYLLDGDVLSPTAVRNPWQPRAADRSDWSRRVETDFERIIRHGDDPTNYWWEVTDKVGTTRYYGGTPDGVRDADSILSDPSGNAFRWGLTAEVDISNNIMRYEYDTVTGIQIGLSTDDTLGTQLYLDSITYTGSLASTVDDDPPYEVRFLRDGDITPTPTSRNDVLVDAMGGALQVTRDLLRRVEVYYGDQVAGGAGDRSYDQLVRGYEFEYDVDGPYGKSLLTAVHQYGTGGPATAHAAHAFEYYKDVLNADGTYNGFTDPIDWDPVDDSLNVSLFEIRELSVLGSSESNSGDVHAYIGFNPAAPSKTGSFGGSISVNGGASEGLTELLDINADNLPDKVFLGPDGVQYRLNTSVPGDFVVGEQPASDVITSVTFGPKRDVVNLDELSLEFDVGINGGPEVYFGVTGQLNIGASFAVGLQYFEDVNLDGLPDFIDNGRVFFNRLVDDGTGVLVPTFAEDSSGTPVPLETGVAVISDVPELEEIEQQQRDSSPLTDTVRRWIAPFSGTIHIDGTVTFEPTVVNDPPAMYPGDGVAVAIQHSGTELWRESLPNPGDSATHDLTQTVSKGEAIYFRLMSVDDGARDEVTWDPTITYSPSSTTLDANGLNQSVYQVSQDFTLAGRPGTRIFLPLEGTVEFEGNLTKSDPTSDDVTVLVTHNAIDSNCNVTSTNIVDFDIDDGTTGTFSLGDTFTASDPIPPVFNGDELQSEGCSDWVEVSIRSDTPIDPTVFSWTPRLFYTDVVGSDVNDLELEVPADIDIYPNNTLTSPVEPWTAPRDDSGATVNASVFGVGSTGGDVVLSVKVRSAGGGTSSLVAKKTFSAVSILGFVGGSTTLNIAVEKDKEYFFDLTIRDPALSDGITSSTVTLDTIDSSNDPINTDVPDTRHWAGRQGIFPISHRGWGAAGYNSAGRAGQAIDESAFDIDEDPDEPSLDPNDNPTDVGGLELDPSFAYVPVYLDVLTDTVPAWRGSKENLVATADFMRSSRTGVDSIVSADSDGAGARAINRFSITGPTLAIAAGVGPLGISGGVGPTFGILDYHDMNGDGLPDVLTPGSVQYTGPRGNYVYTSGSGTTTTDLSFALAGGFSGSPVAFKGGSEGDANNPQNVSSSPDVGSSEGAGSASSASDATGDAWGFGLGIGVSIDGRWTNPNDSLNIPDAISDIQTAPLEVELADVNGDGLPDRVEATPQGVFVYFNTGYGFLDQSVKWSLGGFETSQTVSGSLSPSLGFQYNAFEFAGGISWSESVSYNNFSWVDIDGDGVLDRLRQNGAQNGNVRVGFGTGEDIIPEVLYGATAEGEVELIGSSVPTGPQIAQTRSSALGGGFDFTIGIGPLCLVGCYLIINPGVHFSHEVSATQVQMVDMNGDGYPDSVKSLNDGDLEVRLNRRGRTNLLKSFTNPLGGEVRLDYTRDGNTFEQPVSTWLLTDVQVDDMRPGDGADVFWSTYEYSGNVYDPVEREFLGFSEVIQRQREHSPGATPSTANLLRSFERSYHNETVFHSGLLKKERLLDNNGNVFKESETTWEFLDLATQLPADLVKDAADPAGLDFLELAVTPRPVRVDHRWFDGTGTTTPGQTTFATFAYDDLGNVIELFEENETETTEDNTFTVTTYSHCRSAADPADTWVSVPATVSVYAGNDATGTLIRHRDGSLDLCLNSVPIRIEETISNSGTPVIAITELTFDDWGSYNSIESPENGPAPDGSATNRYRVDYVYDDDRHTDIKIVTDVHGVSAEATYDPFTGRLASRTDANGNITSYEYDAQGRIQTIIGPYEQGTGINSVAFEYVLPAAGSTAHAYSIASHYDAFNPTDTINTVAFLDGIGRETQRKQDADLFTGADTAAEQRMVVEGAVEFDALGRSVKEWYPVTEPLLDGGGSPLIGVYNLETSETSTSVPFATPTMTEWDVADRVRMVTRPVDSLAAVPRVSTLSYEFGQVNGAGSTLFKTTSTDEEGKVIRSYSDVADLVYGIEEDPAPNYVEPGSSPPTLITEYAYDALGRLVQVTDPADAMTTHTYDMLDRRTSTETPDGGLVERTYTAAGSLRTVVDPERRAAGEQVVYSYDHDRLVSVDYPDGTPDVTYTWGDTMATGNGIGRIVEVDDGAMTRTFTYDVNGLTELETAVMKEHNFDPANAEKFTHETLRTYDGLGRVRQLTYPDGEVLEHDYDAGGRLKQLIGTYAAELPAQITYLERREYDEFFDRRFQRTGTGVETLYTFQADTRWLSTLVTDTPTREIQDLTYTYDDIGNIVTANNTLPDPIPSKPEGPATHTYDYDPYYRLNSATGAYTGAQELRDYQYDATYDTNGNLLFKQQTTQSTNAKGGGKGSNDKGKGHPKGGGNSGGGEGNPDPDTTYTIENPVYSTEHPHQLVSIGTRLYNYDLNGNFISWVEPGPPEVRRDVTWDAANRMISIEGEGNSPTEYRYNAEGERAIERGPGGEVSYVNDFWTKHDGPAWKHIWADDDLLALRRSTRDADDPEPPEEPTIYFMHKDLQGSTRMVTDETSRVFQHLEYLPTGEAWVKNDSTIARTPYLFAGGWHDTTFDVVNFDERWYTPREQTFYSPDPVLEDDPLAVVDDPALLSAYTYAESNPLRLVDTDGRRPTLAQKVRLRTARALGFDKVVDAINQGRTVRAADSLASRMYLATIQTDSLGRPVKLNGKAQLTQSAKDRQAFSEKFDAAPLFEFTFGANGKLIKIDFKPLLISPEKVTFTKTFGVGEPADGGGVGNPPEGPLSPAQSTRPNEAPARAQADQRLSTSQANVSSNDFADGLGDGIDARPRSALQRRNSAPARLNIDAN